MLLLIPGRIVPAVSDLIKAVAWISFTPLGSSIYSSRQRVARISSYFWASNPLSVIVLFFWIPGYWEQRSFSIIGNVTASSPCDCSFARQSGASLQKKDCVWFAMWQKASRDHPVCPWVDILLYLPSIPQGLPSCHFAVRVLRPLFATLRGGNAFCVLYY